MEFDHKEETPYNISWKKVKDKKMLAIYIGVGLITISSLIYGYASYQATYFKDAEIKKLKADLEEANTKLQRIDALENQVKTLEASLATKSSSKEEAKKETKTPPKNGVKKNPPHKRVAKKAKSTKGIMFTNKDSPVVRVIRNL